MSSPGDESRAKNESTTGSPMYGDRKICVCTFRSVLAIYVVGRAVRYIPIRSSICSLSVFLSFSCTCCRFCVTISSESLQSGPIEKMRLLASRPKFPQAYFAVYSSLNWLLVEKHMKKCCYVKQCTREVSDANTVFYSGYIRYLVP